jgi:NAD-dependent deacetylase
MAESDLTDDFLVCQCCATPQRLRPDIVWFGEMPLQMEEIYAAVEQSDMFIVVGSSGHVYPAAGLVNIAHQAGARTVLVNLEPPLNAEAFDEVHLGKAGKLLPELLKYLN